MSLWGARPSQEQKFLLVGTIEFYTDEYVARAVVRGLRERGVDVSTVAEAALSGGNCLAGGRKESAKQLLAKELRGWR